MSAFPDRPGRRIPLPARAAGQVQPGGGVGRRASAWGVHGKVLPHGLPGVLTDGVFEDMLMDGGFSAGTRETKEDMHMKKHVLAALAALALLMSPCLVPAAQEAAPAPAAGAAPAAREAATQEVHGNPGSKVYHLPSCRYYNSKGASKVFKTAEEAAAAGYRPCKSCGGKGGA